MENSLKCPFCQKPVKEENEAVVGCKKCIEKWLKEQNVDHLK